MNKFLRDKFIEVREKKAEPAETDILKEIIESVLSFSTPNIFENEGGRPKVRTYNISEIPMIPMQQSVRLLPRP